MCYAPDGALKLVLDCVPYYNGICLSPDSAWVYVAATCADQVWRPRVQFPDIGAPMVGTFLHLSGGLVPDGVASNVRSWLAVAQAQVGRAYVPAIATVKVRVKVMMGTPHRPRCVACLCNAAEENGASAMLTMPQTCMLKASEAQLMGDWTSASADTYRHALSTDGAV